MSWAPTRVRYVAEVNPAAAEWVTSQPALEPSFLPMEAIGEDASLRLDQTRPVESVRNGYSFFQDGDVAFAKVTPCFENGKAAVMAGLAEGVGFGTTELTVVRANSRILNRFLFYVLTEDRFRQLGKSAMTGAGGLKRVPDLFTKDFSFPLPSLAEQGQVVDFLDRETAQIDGLIGKQERLIELLAEKRQAIITYAVTKGLKPTAPTKPSGIPWLGDVPAHWRVAALKHVLRIPISDGPHETPEFLDEGVPFVSAEAVSKGVINFSKIRGFISVADNERYSRKYSPRRGDIYMVKSGATTGVTALVETDQEFNIWSPLAAIRCDDTVLPEFLLAFLRSRAFLDSIALHWSFGTQQNIGMGVLGDLPVAVPPMDEQRRIAEHLSLKFRAMDRLQLGCTRSIELLKERRSALISAAVTGKIDVTTKGVTA